MATRKKRSKLVDLKSINILVCLSLEWANKLEKVEAALKAAGMTIDAKFPITGTIAGRASLPDILRIRAIEGVESVEEESNFTAV